MKQNYNHSPLNFLLILLLPFLGIQGQDQDRFTLRINAGGSEIDYNRETYSSDNYFDTGLTLDRPQTGLPEPFQTFRYSRSQQLSYDIPVPDGEYTVNLYFAELWFGASGGGAGGVGKRVFDINIEGQLAEDNLDIFAQAGGAETKLVRTHLVTITDGVLNIDFDSRDAVGGERHPVINAIEILGEESVPEQRPFITIWEASTITIRADSSGDYNYTVDWGDGTISEDVTGEIAHTYEASGTQTVSITGDFPRFPGSINNRNLKEIKQWGDIQWKSFEGSFTNISSVDISATDVPDLQQVTSFADMFGNSGVSNSSGSVSRWDVGNVRDMSGMFFRSNLDLELGDWDVSNVVDMSNMFEGTLYAKDMGIRIWDVGSVKNMDYMFFYLDNDGNFNEDIGDWNVLGVESMVGMFSGSGFDQDIGDWDVSNVMNMFDMFTSSGLSNENYDKILLGWSQLSSLQNGIRLDAPQNKYCEAEQARQHMIDNYGWTINDAGKAEDCDIIQDFALRINTGGSEIDYNGQTYIADSYFNTGNTLDRPQTGLPEPYQTFRFSRSQQMGYDIPVPDGEFTVNLHFAELWFGATGGAAGGVGSRVFDVIIEGQLAENDLDIFAAVGADQMLVKTHTVTVTDGVLNIDFDSRDAVGGERHPVINAIEILGESSEPEQRPFIFSFKPRAFFGDEGLTLGIPIDSQYQYNYNIDWGDGTIDENITEAISHTYESWDITYMVEISGNFPRPLLNESSNSCDNAVYEILQWGDQKWQNLESAFENTTLSLEANDIPDLSECSSIRNMFKNSEMKGNGMALIPQWDISGFTDLSGLFHGTTFNEDISGWDVSHVTDMSYLFSSGTLGCGDDPLPIGGVFSQDISTWNVSNVENMEAMFNGCPFNHDITSWDVSGVTNMSGMFAGSKFNQDISDWDVSRVSEMAYMFSGTIYNEVYKSVDGGVFNQPLNDWDVSNVSDMNSMFSNATSFNQDIGDWDVGNVESMLTMFLNAINFDQDLGNWNVGNVTQMFGMFNGATLSIENYDSLLNSWSNQQLQSDVTFDAGNSQYCDGEEARQKIIEDFGWTILDPGRADTCPNATSFITTWKTDNPGTSEDNQITIPTFPGETYDYTVDWGDGTITTGETGNATHTYPGPGTYQVSISGDFPRIYFNDTRDKFKLLSIDQWGDNVWLSMHNAFLGCANLDVIANDTPNLSNVSSIANMFADCRLLVGTEQFNSWDTSNVIDMSGMFVRASAFNSNIGNWDVSSVTQMNDMFLQASIFNQDLNNWQVQNVLNMSDMFAHTSFNSNIEAWDVGNVLSMDGMFFNTPFNSDISEWNISNVRKIDGMFGNSSFNQNISGWDVSNVKDMSAMFIRTEFNQDLSSWNVSNVEVMDFMFSNSGLSNINYNNILIGWSQLSSLQSGVQLDAPQNQYCDSEQARQHIIDTYGWTINDAGKARDCGIVQDFAIRINTGGAETEYNGETFDTDTYFNAGLTLDRPQTGLPEPFQTFRYSRSQLLSYDIPVPNGEYTVNLYFAELWFGATGGGSGGVGSRVFDVKMEGQLIHDNLDIFYEVGAEKMLLKSNTITVSDGILHIGFDSRDVAGGERHPVINAIEILDVGNSGGSGKLAIDKGQDDNNMELYPNQVSDFATVSFEKPTEVQQIYVFDMIGRLIQSYSPKAIRNGDDYNIDVNSYQQGAYIIKMIDTKGAHFEKQMLVKRE